MFGKFLNVITIPARIVVAPIKVVEETIEGRKTESIITDTVRYAVTAKEKNPTMNSFLDFDAEDDDL